jgi:hypothetical protein
LVLTLPVLRQHRPTGVVHAFPPTAGKKGSQQFPLRIENWLRCGKLEVRLSKTTFKVQRAVVLADNNTVSAQTRAENDRPTKARLRTKPKSESGRAARRASFQ